jgi:hypothetical protein
MILLLFWGHEPCIGFFLRRFNTPDALICYPGSIEKLKLLGATYLLTLAAIQQSLAGLLSAVVKKLPKVFLSKHEPCRVDQNVMLFGVKKFVWMAIGKKCLRRRTILKTVLAVLLYPKGITALHFFPYEFEDDSCLIAVPDGRHTSCLPIMSDFIGGMSTFLRTRIAPAELHLRLAC